MSPEITRYQFDGFVVDIEGRLVLKDGRIVALNSKAFDLLIVLLQNNRKTVTREELLETVWPDTSVEPNNLTVNMSALRKALGDHSGGHWYIVTVPGKGYR